MTFVVEAADPQMCLAVRGNIIVCELRQSMRGVERPTIVHDRGLRFAEQHPEGGGLLVVVRPGAGLPDAAAVRVMSKTAMALAKAFPRIAYVVEERGLAGAALRGAIRAVFAMVPSSMQVRVFEEDAPAIEWLAREIDPATDPSELLRAVNGMQRTYAGLFPR